MKLTYPKTTIKTREFTIKKKKEKKKKSGCLSVIYRWKIHRMRLKVETASAISGIQGGLHQSSMKNFIAGFKLML
jgi:hypothetical protein